MAVTVEPLTPSLTKLRALPWLKVDINALRYNQVGAFSITCPAVDAVWDIVGFDADGVLQPTAGLFVDWNGVFDVPLMVEQVNPSKLTDEDGKVTETLVFSGGDYFALLANRHVFRDATKAWTAQTPGTTTVSGKAETVIKQLVAANVVTAGDTSRRVPGFTVAPDLARGSTVTYSIVIRDPAVTTGSPPPTTPDSLMDMIRAVALQSDIGVSINLVDGQLVFDCYLPRDLTQKVVFSERLGSMRSWSITDNTPTANAVLMQAGTTTGAFSETHGAGALDPWRRVETYVDQSSTTEAAQILQSQLDEVAKGAAVTKVALQVTDIPRLRFGRDAPGIRGYGIGDLVAGDIRDGLTYSDKVTSVQLTADATVTPYSETVVPTIGAADTDTAASDATVVAQLAARVRQLERALAKHR